MTGRRGAVRVGCSGYDYDHWAGPFYPEGLPHDERFASYAERFDCVEINNTFYTLPEAKTVEAWRDRAPRGFRYALKMSRYGTHMKRLKAPDAWLVKFLDVAERLGSRLGPVLVQLPPRWRADVVRLRGFLEAAPRRVRWAIEFRDADWLRDEVYEALRDHDAALCLHDMLDDHPEVVTAGWVYLRFHGPHAGRRCAGGYSHQYLTARAERIGEWAADGLDVYAFFNNDVGAHAPRDALALRRYLAGREPANA